MKIQSLTQNWTKQFLENKNGEEPNLSRSDDYIVNGNKDQVDEEPNKSHHDETDSCTECHFSEFCVTVVCEVYEKC